MSVNREQIPVFILCGGLGTRLREQTEFRPKPMIEVGNRPILWHIMRTYSAHGFRRFILCTGYRSEVVKSYFLNYASMNSDFTVSLRTNDVHVHSVDHDDDWEVTIAYTGEETMTGGRIARAAAKFLGKADHFAVTYGDGLTNADLRAEFDFHLSHDSLGTVLGVNPPSRFGEFKLEGEHVTEFEEKPEFGEMIAFRDRIAAQNGIKLLVHTNRQRIAEGVSPFTYDSDRYTALMKTEALKQALDAGAFDMVMGGARRDEEKSRAKERIFSFRSVGHRWDPKIQRPELWNVYNTRIHPGETIRVFPLSNWTEADIWQYIAAENIPIVPLYFAAPRPVVRRSGQWIMVDDDRFPLNPGEVPEMRIVRFRTLGCYPLTAAVESTATTIEEIVRETQTARTSERQGRLIDHDRAASMEKKKQEGYF